MYIVTRKLLVPTSGSLGQLPFLNDAYDRGLVNNGDSFKVKRIAETRSKSGFLLTTDRFVVLLYKSSPWAEVLVSTLLELIEEDPSNPIYLTVDESQPQGVELWIEEDEGCIWAVEKKFGGVTVWTPTIGVVPGSGITRKSRRAAKQGM